MNTIAIVQNYSKIMPYVKPYKGRVILGFVIAMPIGMMDAAIAWILKPYMDVVMIGKATGTAMYLPLLIVAFSVVQSLLAYASTYLNTWAGRKIANDVKIYMFEKLMTKEASFFDSSRSGDILFRFSADVDLACNGLLSNLKFFVIRIVTSISLIFVLFYNSWQLAIIAVSVLLGALYPLTRMRKKIKSLVEESVFTGSEVITHYNEVFGGNRIVSSYNLYEYQKKRFAATLHRVFKIGMKMMKRTAILTPLMHFLVAMGIAGVLWLQSYLIISGEITPGNFVSFLTALIMLYTPIKSLGNNFNNVQMSIMAMERLFEMAEAPAIVANKPDAKKLTSVKDAIEYKGVCFEYNTDKPVLSNVNVKIKVGSTVAFVGNSGGGKTTLVNLLPRFYDVKEGAITVDGTDIRDVELNSLRDNIAIVFQDNFLFAGTIRENIVLDKKDIADEDVLLALKNACLDEFIDTLEMGLDTHIGERGVLLSGGQKQRIGIARAFIKNAPIVILDEATSALDNKSEAVVQQAINNLMKDRTVLVIAHRLSTIRNADKIVVVNYGEIAEEGSHEELLEKNGIYAALYNSQKL